MRTYTAFFWVGDDHDEITFSSDHRKGSRANREDAYAAIYRQRGRYIGNRAEITLIYRNED